MLPNFLFLYSLPCSVDHERDWPPFKVVFQYTECEKQQQRKLDSNLRIGSVKIWKAEGSGSSSRSRVFVYVFPQSP